MSHKTKEMFRADLDSTTDHEDSLWDILVALGVDSM